MKTCEQEKDEYAEWVSITDRILWMEWDGSFLLFWR